MRIEEVLREIIDDAAFEAALDAITEDRLPPINGEFAAALTCAVLRQAVLDYWSDDPELREDAAGWFAECDQRPYGFGFCCAVLGADPRALVEAVVSGRVRTLPEPTS
jgi:hypothetical protein